MWILTLYQQVYQLLIMDSNQVLAWDQAEELNTSLRELSDQDLIDCRQALIDRSKEIMDLLG